MARGDGAMRAMLRNAVEHGDTDAMPAVLAAIRATGGLDYSRSRARDFARAAEAALEGLSDNAYVAALRGLARYAVSRDH
jgi:octaprenyl-diphosphate synthase